jgi:hypothetical protein
MPAKPPAGPPWVIGWKEYVDLPDWSVWRVRTKIDTGARTSALDVASYDLAEIPGEGLVATLRLALHRKRHGKLHEIQVPVLKIVTVINSSGMREQRPLVETTAWLGPCRKRIQLTITNRAGMRFRMILGRQALAHDFVIDVGKKYLQGRGRK